MPGQCVGLGLAVACGLAAFRMNNCKFGLCGLKLGAELGIGTQYGLWVDRVRQGDYQEAYLETMNFRTPLLFWDPLMKAATFGLLGRYEEGKRAVEDLLKLKPDFSTRGRILIGRYIKFEDILERTIDGLRKSGLHVEDH